MTNGGGQHDEKKDAPKRKAEAQDTKQPAGTEKGSTDRSAAKRDRG